jgi:hypothetical protein
MPAMSSREKYADINQHELIDTPIGRIERWRADAVLTGETSAAQEYMKQFQQQFAQLRADSIDLKEAMEQWASELTAREDALNERAQAVADFAGRAAQFYERTESLFNKLKAEAEEGPIPTPPGDEPSATSDVHTAPAGDLHSVEPVHEPELEGSEDEELPPELPRSLPEEPPEPHGSVYPASRHFTEC